MKIDKFEEDEKRMIRRKKSDLMVQAFGNNLAGTIRRSPNQSILYQFAELKYLQCVAHANASSVKLFQAKQKLIICSYVASAC